MSNEVHHYTLEIILEHIIKCESRFSKINKPDDFVLTEQGNILLDSIVTRLQAISENIKRISSQQPQLFEKYPGIEWNKIILFRHFISHHYEMFDYEIVFDICEFYLPSLKIVIETELKSK